jgi:hypothetical protein
MTYGEWAAQWWSWVFEAPVDANPLLDTTGEHCAQGQSGSVWFLAGASWGSPVSRDCEIPADKALFFPLENYAYISWSTDPYTWTPEEEAFWRGVLADGIDTYGGGLVAEIDGVPLVNLDDYRVQSPVFYSWVPDDNYIDFTSGTCRGHGPPRPCSDWQEGDLSGPHVDDGTYLLLMPLSPGEHTLHFAGWNGAVDVTYNLTVE